MNTIQKGYLDQDYHIFYLKDQKGGHFPSHTHDFHKIIVVYDGYVTYQVEHSTYELSPNSILCIPKDQVHKLSVDPNHPYERLVIYLSPAFLDRMCTAQTDLTFCFHHSVLSQEGYIHLNDSISLALKNAISTLRNLEQEHPYGHDILQFTTLLTFLTLLTSTSIPLSAHPDKQKLEHTLPNELTREHILEKAFSYIHSNISQPFTIKHVANATHMSSSYLMHLFKQQTGCTLYQYILEKRIISAKQLLRNPENLALTEIAEKTGFQDYSAFAKAFKKSTGLSPLAYRKQIRDPWFYQQAFMEQTFS